MASEALQFSYALVQRFANSLFGIPLLLLQRFNVMAVAETTGSTPPMYNDWPLSLLSTPTHKTGNVSYIFTP